MAWQRFRVELKGEDEPIEVATCALDWADAPIDAERPLGATFRVVHSALLRNGASVPRDYKGFLEVLDGIPEMLDESVSLDPIETTP